MIHNITYCVISYTNILQKTSYRKRTSKKCITIRPKCIRKHCYLTTFWKRLCTYAVLTSFIIFPLESTVAGR